MFKRSLVPFLLASGLLLAQSHPTPSSEKNQSDEAKSEISPQELARLRPVLLPDIKEMLERIDDTTEPTQDDIESELHTCKFTPLELGELGRAILVQDGGLGGPNAAMLNVYVPDHGSYRRVIKEIGFGPIILKNQRPVPDLVFGTTGGVCHANTVRYRYSGGKYDADACNQEYEDDPQHPAQAGTERENDCPVKKCEGSPQLPSFPDPFKDQ